MDVYHFLICCCCFLSLQDGNTGLTHRGTEGGNITVGCSFSLSGSRRLFCRGECTTGNILIETTSDRAQSGRYTIEYKELSLTSTTMYVSITQLETSDSGLYTCALDRTMFPDSHDEFELIVTEASTSSHPITTLQPATTSPTSPSSSSSSSSSSTQSFSSSSGRFTPSPSSTETNNQPEAKSSAASGSLVLVISLVLVVVIILLSVAVLVFCRKRTSKSKGRPVETSYDHVGESSRVYEEIGQPVEMSTVYTLVNQNEVRNTDEYSLATAPCAHIQAESSYSKLNLKVDAPESPGTSRHTDSCRL